MENRNLSIKENLWAIILLFLIFSSCDPEPEAKLCGPYEKKDEICQQYNVCTYTYMLNSELKLFKESKAGVFTRYEINNGNSIVFKYNYDDPGHPDYADTDYKEELLFQIPENSEEELIEASEFRDHNVFFKSVNFSNSGILKVEEDRGCIYLKKISEDSWEVNINVDYYNYHQEKWNTLQFTEVFYKEDEQ